MSYDEMDNGIPRQPSGFLPARGQGLGAGYVNPTAPRFVDARPPITNNPNELGARRAYARGTDGNRNRITGGGGGGNSDVGGR